MKTNTLEIHFIELPSESTGPKSGDCQLVLFPDGKNMVIDCGIAQTFPYVEKYLRKQGIEKIDTFLMTHPHIDHIGAFPALADAFPISHVLGYPLDYFIGYSTASMDAMNKSLVIHGMQIERIHEGMTWGYGGVEVKILNPPIDFPHTQNDYEKQLGQVLDTTSGEAMVHLLNDCSVCIRMDWGKSSFLNCGDLYFTGEREMLARHGQELHVTVAKANHHGAYTSNTTEWIEAVHAPVVVAQRNVMPPKFPEKEIRKAYFEPHFAGYAYDEYPKHGSNFYLTFTNGNVVIDLHEDGSYEVSSER